MIKLIGNIQDPEQRFAGLPLIVQYIDGIDWRLDRSAIYHTKADEFSTVQRGFVFDFASIPRILWWLWPPAGVDGNPYGIAALFHDWLCVHRQIGGRPITSEEADNLFYEIMLYVKVNAFVAWTMYKAVRMAHITGLTKWGPPKPDDKPKGNMI